LTKTLSENLPEKEKELGIASEIEIEFMISKEGEITHPIIKRSYGGGVDEVILQELVSTSAPRWNPGEINGEKVDIIHSTYLKLSGKVSNNYDSASLAFFPQLMDIPIGRGRNTIINEDTIFDVVQTAPIPMGGMKEWNEYLENNLTYPEESKEKNISGTVYVSFVVDKSGTINDVQTIRGVSPDIDAEAIRVIQAAPNWTPGKQAGKEVNVRMRLPIRFKTNSSAANENILNVTLGNQTPIDPDGWSSPSPKGGMDGWVRYLSDNLKYPKQAISAKQEGTIFLTFLVAEDGSVENVELLRGIGYGIDEEALRLVKEGPKWIPSKKDGEVKKSRMRLPIVFDLDKLVQSSSHTQTN
jgi:TonB family protein